jgi:hypothetical protein
LVRVGGNIASSLIAAGVSPISGDFFNGNDKTVGGASSVIKSVIAKNIDANSRLIAGKIQSVRGPKTIKSPDARLVVLPA